MRIREGCSHFNSGCVGLNPRTGHKSPPLCDVYWVEYVQPRMPVNAGARVPATVCLFGVVDADRNDIVSAEVQMIGELIDKRNVTIGPVAEMMAVNPNVAVLVDAVEFECNHFAAISRRGAELLAVPTNASW